MHSPGTLSRALLLTVSFLALGCAPAQAIVLKNLDFQPPSLLTPNGHPTQWDNYVPGADGTSGITLGSPGTLPVPYVQAARFQPANAQGRPRSMAKLSKHTEPDSGVALSGPL